MAKAAGLSQSDIIAFVPIVNVARAKAFYRDTLGLRLVMEEPPFALEFEANGIMLRLVMLKKMPKENYGSVLGWKVPSIITAVKALQKKGVRFERYGFLEQDELGIWITPVGARVAWFKDPDGNILSLSQHPKPKKTKKLPTRD